MNQEQLKAAVADAAIAEVEPQLEKDTVLGIGTGSTANLFIDRLATLSHRFKGAVASSDASAKRLQQHGIDVFELNDVSSLPFYIDGADEINAHLQMIKGGGAALTREKVVAACAERFICIADESKYVAQLGAFPLPVEVIAMARSYVARQLVALGAEPIYRQGVITDNGHQILDCHAFMIKDPVSMEATINGLPGVVTNGLFVARKADIMLLGRQSGIERIALR